MPMPKRNIRGERKVTALNERFGFDMRASHYQEFVGDADFIPESYARDARDAVLNGRLPTPDIKLLAKTRSARATMNLLTGALIDRAHAAGRTNVTMLEMRDIHEAWCHVLMRNNCRIAASMSLWHLVGLHSTGRPNLIDAVEADMVHKLSDTTWRNPWLVASGVVLDDGLFDERTLDQVAEFLVYELPVEKLWPTIEAVRRLGQDNSTPLVAAVETARKEALSNLVMYQECVAELMTAAERGVTCDMLARRMAYTADLLFEWAIFFSATYHKPERYLGSRTAAELRPLWRAFRASAAADLKHTGRIP